jgi:phosphatidate phosphatase APP1
MPLSKHAAATSRLRPLPITYVAVTEVRKRLARLLTRLGWRPALLPYSGYADAEQGRILARVVLAPASVDPARRRGIAAWRRLLTLERPSVEVEIELGGTTTTAVSDEQGILDATIALAAPLGRGPVDAVLSVPGRESTRVPIHVVTEGKTRGVVCDIDDTVWVTGLSNPSGPPDARSSGRARHGKPCPAWRRSSRRPFATRTSLRSSTSATVRGTLQASRHGSSRGTGSRPARCWGITPTRWFRDGKAHKRSSLSRLRDDLPGVTWALIGDDGEHDPELYTTFAREQGDAVAAIAIRQVRKATGDREQLTRVHGTPVVHGPDGHALLPLLRDALEQRAGDER